MMNVAVRVVNEPKSLLKYDPVAAFARAMARQPSRVKMRWASLSSTSSWR